MSAPVQPTSAETSPIPARRLEPSVRIDDEDERAPGRNQRRLHAYFLSLTDAQAVLLKEVLTELPSVMQSIKAEAWINTERSIDQAFRLTESVLQNYVAEAWAHEQWHESFIQKTPCLTLDEAIDRCAHTPWHAVEDLLVLPHRGSRYVPHFLFGPDGPPNPWWIAVLAALRRETWHDPWKLLAWMMTPQMLLQHRSPLEALHDDPKRVISLAKLATREKKI